MVPDPLQLRGIAIDGKYEVIEFLGQDGRELYYRAQHRAWSEPIGLIVGWEHGLNGVKRDDAIRQFLEASAVVARLSSRAAAFPTVRDGGTVTLAEGPVAFAVTEWLDDPSLRQVLDRVQAQGRGRMNLGPALDWLADVLDAVTLAHHEGLVFGALKPEQLVVIGGGFRPPGPLKLRGALTAAVRRGQPGALIDAYAHASPCAPEYESRDPSRIGPWTDVHDLALWFVELLTGKRPDPRQPLGPSLSPSVHWALERAVTPALDERFRNVEMLREALAEALPTSTERQRPRRTMVVASGAADSTSRSAGAFEVASDGQQESSASEVEARPGARVRFAHTQRIDAVVVGSVPHSGPAAVYQPAPSSPGPSPVEPPTSISPPTTSPSRTLIALATIAAISMIVALGTIAYYLFMR